MNSETSKILSKILGRRELDKIPVETVRKIEIYFDERFEEFINSQAVHESSQRTISKSSYIDLFVYIHKMYIQLESQQAIIDGTHI